jgi:hypothetical protein
MSDRQTETDVTDAEKNDESLDTATGGQDAEKDGATGSENRPVRQKKLTERGKTYHDSQSKKAFRHSVADWKRVIEDETHSGADTKCSCCSRSSPQSP